MRSPLCLQVLGLQRALGRAGVCQDGLHVHAGETGHLALQGCRAHPCNRSAPLTGKGKGAGCLALQSSKTLMGCV